MRALLFVVLVLAAPAVLAASPAFWRCQGADGVTSLQDTACAPGSVVISAPVGARAGQAIGAPVAVPPSAPARSTAENKSARPAAPALKLDVSPMLQPVMKIFGLVIAAGVALTLLKLLGVALLADRRRKRATGVADAGERVASVLSRGPPAPTRPTDWSTDALRQLEWKRLEILCRDLWRARGHTAELTNLGADGGVDVLVHRAGVADPMIVVQCKAWSSKPVPVDEVRALWGVRHHLKAESALLCSTSGYTPAAFEFARYKALELWSGDDLVAALRELPAESSRRIFQATFAGDYQTPTCPSCENKLRLIAPKRGSQKPWFWGCRSFPRCRGSIPARAELIASLSAASG